MGKGYCEGRQIGASLPISDKMLKSSHCVPCVAQYHSSAKRWCFPLSIVLPCVEFTTPLPSPIFPLHSPPPFLLPPSPIHGHCRSLQVNHTHSTSKLPALKVTTWCFTCIVKHTGTVRDTHK